MKPDGKPLKAGAILFRPGEGDDEVVAVGYIEAGTKGEVNMFRRVFAVSRWVHRYLGLVVFLYLILEGITGVLLNHPTLIAGFSVPRWMVPASYHIEDWNRGSLRTIVFSEQNPSLGYLGGSEGVWKTTDGGVTFEPMASGYPCSRADRRTNHLLLLEDDSSARLFAATRNGLFACSLQDEAWRRVTLSEAAEEVLKILRVEDRLVVLTDSGAYESSLGTGPSAFTFRPVHLDRNESGEKEEIPLVMLMFALHGGEIWGLPGRLLIDTVGIGLVFLSVSAIYIWYFPRARRWFPRGPGKVRRGEMIKRRIYRWLYKYHVNVGIWTMAFLVLIAGTALFIPPSPLVLLAIRTKMPRQYWPGTLPSNPWHESIGSAAYDPSRGELLIEAKGDLWRGPADFNAPFTKDESRPPVGPMGTNVMEVVADGALLIGSFSGLYECSPDGGPVIDLSTGKPRDPSELRGPFGRWPTAGYFQTPADEKFVTTQEQGIIAIGEAQLDGRFRMPEAMVHGYRMPLGSFLHEVHNGRIVRDWTGSGGFLIPVLGAMSLLVVSFTGLYDWAQRKLDARGRKAGLTIDAPSQAQPDSRQPSDSQS